MIPAIILACGIAILWWDRARFPAYDPHLPPHWRPVRSTIICADPRQ